MDRLKQRHAVQYAETENVILLIIPKTKQNNNKALKFRRNNSFENPFRSIWSIQTDINMCIIYQNTQYITKSRKSRNPFALEKSEPYSKPPHGAVV